MKKTMLAILLSLFLVGNAGAVLVSGVYEYSGGWGCAPIAAASVLDYYGLPVDVGRLASAMYTTGGSTNVMDIAPGIVNYTQQLGYSFTATTLDYREFSWLNYTNAIDAGQPALFAIDTDGDWNVNHEVVAVGYEDRGADGLWYAFYMGFADTEILHWERFAWSVFNTGAWGIGFATFITPPIVASVPEPATVILVLIGSLMLFVGGAIESKPNFN